MTNEEKALTPSEINSLKEKDGITAEIGEVYFDKYYGLFEVTGFEPSQNGERCMIVGRMLSDNKIKKYSAHEFRSSSCIRAYIRPGQTPEEYWKEMSDKAVEAFLNPSMLDEAPEESTPDTLALTTDKADPRQLKVAEQELTRRKEEIAMMQHLIENRMNKISSIKSLMTSRLDYVSKVLKMFEAYLGVYEQIQLIREGEPAPADTPLTFRQMTLYMDEEVGDVEVYANQVGIDFRRIDDFDAWVIKDRHFELLVPEQKCVVAIRPTRQQRDYGGDIFFNLTAMAENSRTYLLIRNGERLYRIWTETKIGSRLFPTLAEMQKINEEILRAEEIDSETSLLRAKGNELSWREHAVLLQGLIDRTDVFAPMAWQVSLFDETSYDTGRLNLIRDDEVLTLPSGRVLYKDWKREVNEGIQRGSRIILAPRYGNSYYESSRDHLWWFRDHFGGNRYYSYPQKPAGGVYKIEEVIPTDGRHHKGDRLRFLYLPTDEIWRRDEDGYLDYGERSRRVSFYVYKHDAEVLNYDGISLEDVQYYISNRTDRRNYRDMLPVLYEIRAARLKELQQEKAFVEALAQRLDVSEEMVWEAVEWWKTKNLWKRPIIEDDAKAWRMITKRLNNEQ